MAVYFPYFDMEVICDYSPPARSCTAGIRCRGGGVLPVLK